MAQEEKEEIRYISITDTRARKLDKFKTEGKIPSTNWAVKMGVAIGILTGKMAGKKFGGRGHGVDVEAVDPQGLFRILVGKDVAQYARGGLDILINELEKGKSVFDIYRRYFEGRPK
jgi:hypothetical protein